MTFDGDPRRRAVTSVAGGQRLSTEQRSTTTRRWMSGSGPIGKECRRRLSSENVQQQTVRNR